MMEQSIQCLTLGLLGLLPLIGVVFAPAGLWCSYAARRKERHLWNPAKPHRIIGLICASIGALTWGAVDTIIIFNMVNNYINA
jgi:hypothetical protein